VVNESWFGARRPRKCLGHTDGTVRIQPPVESPLRTM
jgi:hypothetical protein